MLQHGWTVKALCWVKLARHRGTNILWFHLYVMRSLEESNSWRESGGYQELGGGRMGSYGLMSTEFPFGEGEKAPEMGVGDGFYTLIWIHLMPSNGTPKKRLKWQLLCLFFHNKKGDIIRKAVLMPSTWRGMRRASPSHAAPRAGKDASLLRLRLS